MLCGEELLVPTAATYMTEGVQILFDICKLDGVALFKTDPRSILPFTLDYSHWPQKHLTKEMYF